MSKLSKKDLNPLMENFNEHEPKPIVLTLHDPDDNSELLTLEVKRSMSIEEMGMFVDRVVYACFDTETDEFTPEYLDPIFEITRLQMLTNVPVYEKSHVNSEGKKVSIVDIEKSFRLCMAINLSNSVNDAYFQILCDRLQKMVQSKLEYVKARKLNGERRRLETAMAELETGTAQIVAISEKLTESMSHMMQTQGLSAAMEKMDYQSMVNAVLSGAV